MNTSQRAASLMEDLLASSSQVQRRVVFKPDDLVELVPLETKAAAFFKAGVVHIHAALCQA